jgi:hypothetical protein
MPNPPWQTVDNPTGQPLLLGQLIHSPQSNSSEVAFFPSILPYSKYMSRLNLMLQNHGRHVADIAVLYPIATLQAGLFA